MVKREPIADLPNGVGVSKILIKGIEYWRVRLGKKFTGGSIRVKHFIELKDARKWINGDTCEDSKKASLKLILPGVTKIKDKLGAGAFVLTPMQMAEAQDAFRRLPKAVSLTEVIDDWLKRRAPVGGLKSVDEVTKEFMVSRRSMGVRDRTIVQYESYFRSIVEEFGTMPISDVERSQIEDWLAESEWSARTRKNYLVTLTTLLNFAQSREYCAKNPAAVVERPILEDNAPGILTVGQARAILDAAKEGVEKVKFKAVPEMVAGIAIGLFAGLRRSELCSLDWKEIDLTARLIEIKAAKAKTRQRRLVSINDCLAAWLEPRKKEDGPVAPFSSQDVFGERLNEIAKAAGISKWPHNAMRHSFGSYFYALHKNENLTASEMGNSPAVVFKHYRAIVKNGEETRYWALRPKTA